MLTTEEYERAMKMHDALLALGDTPCCIVCEKFSKADQKCSLWNELPPAHVIVHGCPSFSFLPF